MPNEFQYKMWEDPNVAKPTATNFPASMTTPAPTPATATSVGGGDGSKAATYAQSTGSGSFSFIPAVGSFISAAKQQRELNKFRKSNFDLTPQAFKDELQLARSQANNFQVAGQSGIIDNINASTQAAMGNVNRTTQSGAQALAAATRLGQGQQNQMRSLGISGAQAQEQRQNALMNKLARQSQYQFMTNDARNRTIAAFKQSIAGNIQAGLEGVATGLNTAKNDALQLAKLAM
jgi:hypothetical protein